MQASRRRDEDRDERKERAEAKNWKVSSITPDPDTVAEISHGPPPPREAPPECRVLCDARPAEADANTRLQSSGFVSHFASAEESDEPDPEVGPLLNLS
jgi:hypothetical protein